MTPSCYTALLFLLFYDSVGLSAVHTAYPTILGSIVSKTVYKDR